MFISSLFAEKVMFVFLMSGLAFSLSGVPHCLPALSATSGRAWNQKGLVEAHQHTWAVGPERHAWLRHETLHKKNQEGNAMKC